MATLNEVMKDTADAIREKTGKSDLIAPVDFAEEIKSISVGGGESGDWEYYKIPQDVIDLTTEMGMLTLMGFIGLRTEGKQLVGKYNSKQWWYTNRGSILDFITIGASGQDDYTGAPWQIAIDLSHRIISTRSTNNVNISYRELLYADESHPLFAFINMWRAGHPICQLFLNATKISKEEWERDDYTGVILE